MALVSINPATGEVLQEYEAMTLPMALELLQKVHQAQMQWRQKTLPQRASALSKLEVQLKRQEENLARRMTLEMGKPLQQARAEIRKCAWACAYFAQHGPKFLKDISIKTEARRSWVTFQPLGIVLAIMPWNFPFWQVFRFGVPALLAGNGILLKHAQNVSGCALDIEALFAKAGLPQILRTILIAHDQVDEVTETLVDHPLIKAVTLTGSTRAGRSVAEKSGKALKKIVLELGGSDPYLIFKDADLKKAVPLCAASRLNNAGQSCIAAKRFIVDISLKNKFEEQMVEVFASKKVGDPLQPENAMGPLARVDLRDALHRQVTNSMALGARLLLGGEVPPGKGAFYPPTILTDVKKGMPAFDEELFGPVASIIVARSEKEAILLANDSNYGLGAGIFSRNRTRALKIAREQLDCGACFINSFVQSDPRLPFGGVKDSGFGRELGEFGIHEFVNIKSVSVD